MPAAQGRRANEAEVREGGGPSNMATHTVREDWPQDLKDVRDACEKTVKDNGGTPLSGSVVFSEHEKLRT